MSIVWAGVLSQHLSSWLLQVHAVRHSVFFFGVATANIFLSVNKMMLTSLDVFQQLF